MQKFSYHTHTTLSDGSDCLDNMLQKAVELGWKQIGISDHMIIHKDIKQAPTYEKMVSRSGDYVYYDSFEKCLPMFQKNAEYIRKTAKKYPIDVLVGFEVDYFTYNGWEDEFKNFIKQIDYDYLLTGNHFFFDEKCEVLIDIYRYDLLDDIYKNDSYETYIKRHYQTIRKAVSSKMFNFLAHFDYARRTKQSQIYPCRDEQLKIVDCLAENHIAAEVSTKGLRKNNILYPDDFVLKNMINKGVELVISDDAHNVDELGYCFDETSIKLEQMGCKKRFCLK
ncbi:MAG: PHP domain-containing protein [Alphaproteobacteria bacterium]|nr:PHP domain-containing protein [Alphaproteobacteria bacterium]